MWVCRIPGYNHPQASTSCSPAAHCCTVPRPNTSLVRAERCNRARSGAALLDQLRLRRHEDPRNLLAPDFTSVEQEIWDRGKVLDFVRMFFSRCSLAPVEMLDPHVTFLTPGIATVVYHPIESPTFGTHTMSGDTNISTVWVLRQGRWQMHLHTEYAVPPKP